MCMHCLDSKLLQRRRRRPHSDQLYCSIIIRIDRYMRIIGLPYPLPPNANSDKCSAGSEPWIMISRVLIQFNRGVAVECW